VTDSKNLSSSFRFCGPNSSVQLYWRFDRVMPPHHVRDKILINFRLKIAIFSVTLTHIYVEA